MGMKREENISSSSNDRDVKSSSKQHKPNRKDRRDRSKQGNGYKKTEKSNDFAWHTPDAELLRRASETSWSWQTGELLDMNAPLYGPSSATMRMTSLPGLVVIHDHMSIGGAGYLTPTQRMTVNQMASYNAANTLLTEMRSKARLRNTYDAPDVFMLMMAMANIYAGVILAKRLAGTVRMFTYKNQYLPEILIQAQGFDPDWFKKNQYRFVTELNVIISEINKVYVPDRMHLFKLINERFSGYFTEGSDIRDQLYVITPAFLSIYNTNSGSGWASEITPYMCIPGTVTNWGLPGQASVTAYSLSAQYTGDDLLHALRRMLENVLIDTTTADITGDMANCFGDQNRYYLPDCNPDAICVPTFDEEILEMIHNMSWSRAVSNAYWNYNSAPSSADDTFKIIQDPTDNRIGTYDCFKYTNGSFYENILEAESSFRLIDVHKDPNPEKTFAITRMRNITGMRTVDSTANAIWVNMIFGADLICDVQYWFYTLGSSGPSIVVRGINQSVSTSVATTLTDICRMSPFHYRPFFLPVDGTTGIRESIWPVGECDIFAQIDQDMMRNTNLISLLTLLGAYNNIG